MDSLLDLLRSCGSCGSDGAVFAGQYGHDEVRCANVGVGDEGAHQEDHEGEGGAVAGV